ncbi:MAG: flagellar protein FlaG [Methylophilaceae bacterium]|nr:flagellar protein FlaG [Methylophilaceae bacterium]
MSITAINGSQSIREPSITQAKVPVVDLPKKPDKTTEAVAQNGEQPDAKEMQGAVDELNKAMLASAQNIQFSMDQDLGKIVVKVMDTETQKVLRQMPSQEALAFSKNISRLQGLMIHDKA